MCMYYIILFTIGLYYDLSLCEFMLLFVYFREDQADGHTASNKTNKTRRPSLALLVYVIIS